MNSNHNNQNKNNKGQFQKLATVDKEAIKELSKDFIIQELQGELYAGYTDLDKITRVYQLIVGNQVPANIRVMKQTIMNYAPSL